MEEKLSCFFNDDEKIKELRLKIELQLNNLDNVKYNDELEKLFIDLIKQINKRCITEEQQIMLKNYLKNYINFELLVNSTLFTSSKEIDNILANIEKRIVPEDGEEHSESKKKKFFSVSFRKRN